MPSIFDVVTAKNAKTFIEKQEQPKLLGNGLFSVSKQSGLELSYLKGRGGLPIQIQPAAFDAPAPLRGRIGVSTVKTEMPFFREGTLVGEKERQQINTFLQAGQTSQAEIILTQVYNDTKGLVDGTDVIRERMQMQVLSSGTIDIIGTAEGVAVQYDYQLAPEQFEVLTGTDTWDNANSNPIEQIEEWVRKSGGKRAICNSTTFNLLRKHPSVIEVVADASGKKFVTQSDVKAYFENEFDLVIGVYDDEFLESATAAPQKYFPDNVFTLIPNGVLGEFVYGTTPEESDLLNGIGTEAEVEVVNAGVAITTIKQAHPVNIQTYVSMIGMPSFPQAGKIFIATVAE